MSTKKNLTIEYNFSDDSENSQDTNDSDNSEDNSTYEFRYHANKYELESEESQTSECSECGKEVTKKVFSIKKIENNNKQNILDEIKIKVEKLNDLENEIINIKKSKKKLEKIQQEKILLQNEIYNLKMNL